MAPAERDETAELVEDLIERDAIDSPISERDETADLVEDLIERDAMDNPITERDETAELVADLIERNAIGDLISERDVAATQDLTSCIGSCTAIYNGATICRNNVGSLIGHAF